MELGAFYTYRRAKQSKQRNHKFFVDLKYSMYKKCINLNVPNTLVNVYYTKMLELRSFGEFRMN